LPACVSPIPHSSPPQAPGGPKNPAGLQIYVLIPLNNKLFRIPHFSAPAVSFPRRYFPANQLFFTGIIHFASNSAFVRTVLLKYKAFSSTNPFSNA